MFYKCYLVILYFDSGEKNPLLNQSNTFLREPQLTKHSSTFVITSTVKVEPQLSNYLVDKTQWSPGFTSFLFNHLALTYGVVCLNQSQGKI